jgi:RNA polymerase sigma-70 factor (ECF subfamily)
MAQHAVEDFEAYRPLLFSIAYRMLGSATEAEDLVQDAYLRYRTAPAEEIRSPKSYLTTVVTRLAFDQLKSARVRREQYVGTWLPEPLLTESDTITPLDTLEQRESLSFAFLTLLESLSPPERAVFLLHEVFDFGYDEIAEALETSAANCRQILHRAKGHLAARRPRFSPPSAKQRELLQRFIAACTGGDLAALTDLLARDAVMWGDGGGKAVTILRPVVGADAVAHVFLGFPRNVPTVARVEMEEVNGAPALLLFENGVLATVICFAVENGRIAAIYGARNPDKLAFIARQLKQRP